MQLKDTVEAFYRATVLSLLLCNVPLGKRAIDDSSDVLLGMTSKDF